MKTCVKCKATKPLTDFGTAAAKRGGLRRRCKVCISDYMREYRRTHPAKYKRACTSCREFLDITEPVGKCYACVTTAVTTHLSSGLPSRLGRPGCIVYGSVCKVLDAANERWVEMPVKLCKLCGLDQHLDECLDCTAPIGAGARQKSVKALKPCVACGDWAAQMHCPSCVVQRPR